MIAKKGDIIQWDFNGDKYKNSSEQFKGKVFTAEVEVVNAVDREYGVYAIYGQDWIPFDECKILVNE